MVILELSLYMICAFVGGFLISYTSFSYSSFFINQVTEDATEYRTLT